MFRKISCSISLLVVLALWVPEMASGYKPVVIIHGIFDVPNSLDSLMDRIALVKKTKTSTRSKLSLIETLQKKLKTF